MRSISILFALLLQVSSAFAMRENIAENITKQRLFSHRNASKKDLKSKAILYPQFEVEDEENSFPQRLTIFTRAVARLMKKGEGFKEPTSISYIAAFGLHNHIASLKDYLGPSFWERRKEGEVWEESSDEVSVYIRKYLRFEETFKFCSSSPLEACFKALATNPDVSAAWVNVFPAPHSDKLKQLHKEGGERWERAKKEYKMYESLGAVMVIISLSQRGKPARKLLLKEGAGTATERKNEWSFREKTSYAEARLKRAMQARYLPSLFLGKEDLPH